MARLLVLLIGLLWSQRIWPAREDPEACQWNFFRMDEARQIGSILRTELRLFHGVRLNHEESRDIIALHFSEGQLRLFVSDGQGKPINEDQFARRLEKMAEGHEPASILETLRKSQQEAYRIFLESGRHCRWCYFETFLSGFPIQIEIRHLLSRHENSIRRRVAKIRLTKFFKDHTYPLQVQENEVVFPNGIRYPILKREEQGVLVIGVPAERVTPLPRIRPEPFPTSSQGLAALASEIFEGAFLPDSRVLVWDRYITFLKYRYKVSETIPFRLDPSGTSYHSHSFAFALEIFDRGGLEHWIETLNPDDLNSPDGQNRLLVELEASYNRILGLRPIN